MSIIKASSSDLIEMLFLLKVCLQEMNCRTHLHCDLHDVLMQNHIEDNLIFIYKEHEVCLGLILLDKDTAEVPEYKNAMWEASPKPIMLNHIIVHPNWHHQGIEEKLITFAEQYARDSGFTSLRLSVFGENEEAIALYHQLNYNKSGEIKLHYQQIPYYCFEKVLRPDNG